MQRHLHRGDVVRVLSRNAPAGLPEAVEVHRGDITSDSDALARFVDGAQVLYHCAAEIRNPEKMAAVNVEGTRRLVGAARHRIACWVHLGSIAAYGEPRHGAVTEAARLQPVNEYGRTKAEADRLVMEAAEQGGFRCAILRPSKIFGADIASGTNQILCRMISIIDKRLYFFVGRPGAVTNYIHVDNVVEALMRCGAAPSNHANVYNLSDDCTIEDFVAAIAGELGKPLPWLRLPEAPVRLFARAFGVIPGFPLNESRVNALVNRATFPCERIRRELGYEHLVPVIQGLRGLVRSWKQGK